MKLSYIILMMFCCSQNLFCALDKRQDEIDVSPSYEFNEEQVKSYYDKPSDNKKYVRSLIESGFFEHSKEILDVGCGDGKLTAIFAANLPNTSITGCDVSKTMVQFALKHHTTTNLNFVEMNAENLDFGKQFDTVISFNCLHWIENQKRALHQIYHVLKPGGKALLVATPESSNNDFKTICRSIIISFRWAPYFITYRSVHSFHTEKEYKKILISAGFLMDRVEVKSTELVFRNKGELDAFLLTVLTPLQHLEPRHRPAFLKDFFKELKRRGRVDVDGSIHLVFDQIELEVSKGT